MQVGRSLWLDSRPWRVEFLVRGVTAPQRTVFQPPIWELSNRSGGRRSASLHRFEVGLTSESLGRTGRKPHVPRNEGVRMDTPMALEVC